jgi:hypothetical protein
MATKYDVASLRKRFHAKIAKGFPAGHDLSCWDSTRTRRIALDRATAFPGSSLPHILLVQMSRELNIPAILPSALFRCAISPWSAIMAGNTDVDGTALELSATDKKLVVEARIRLLSMFHAMFLPWTGSTPSRPTAQCRGVSKVACRSIVRDVEQSCFAPSWDKQTNVFMLPFLLSSHFSRLCKSCLADFKKDIEQVRGEIWATLPTWFGFESWNAVMIPSEGSPAVAE